MKKIKFVFFGSSRFSCLVLDALFSAGFIPSLVVATPSKPSGRKLALTPPPTKIWADLHGVPCFQPEKLRSAADLNNAGSDVKEKLESETAEVFIVASYGKIIPKDILNIPPHGTLNVHPSLLPKLRGATPLQSSILTEEKTGVTVILLDEEVDHGPIIGQAEYTGEWPISVEQLEEKLAKQGGELLAQLIPDWVGGKIKAVEQDHSQATFTKKISKEDGLIEFSDISSENTVTNTKNYRKILAYAGWPNAYFFVEHNGKKIRVTIKEAVLQSESGIGKLKITKVIPEGKKEMLYEDFLRGLRS